MTRRRSHARASRFSCVAVVAIHQKVPRSIDRGSGQISGSVFLIALTPAWMAARVFPMIRSRSAGVGVIYKFSRKYCLHDFVAGLGQFCLPRSEIWDQLGIGIQMRDPCFIAKDPNWIRKSLSLRPAYFWINPPLLSRLLLLPPSL